MNIHKLQIGLSLILLLLSCEKSKDVFLPIPYAGDKFVIQGFVSQQEGIWAYISVTTDPNNKYDDSKVGNIKVTILANDKVVGQLIKRDSGYYAVDSTFDVKTGTQYQLVVEGMGLEKTITPKVEPIPYVEMKKVELLKIDSFTGILSLNFNDRPGKNAYDVNISKYKNGIRLVDVQLFDKYFNNITFFDDKSFEAKNKSYAEEIFLYKQDNGKSIKIFADELEIKLFSISPALQQFLESVYKDEETRSDPAYDPLPIYNNVTQGGFGIFAAYSASVKKIKI